MTPIEKAKELVEKFRIKFPMASPDDFVFKQAKQCALITINEILQTNPTIKGTSDDLITMIVQTKAYWYRVIEEIHKL